MLYCVISSQLIIGLNQISFEPRAGAHEQDDRNIRVGEHLSLCDRQRTRSFVQDNAVAPLGDQQFQIQSLFVPLVVAVAKQDAIACLLRSVFRGPNDGGEKRIRDVCDHHPDGVSLLFREAAGEKIGPVAEFADRRFHTTAKRGTYAALVIDHGRYREYRHPSLAGHVVNTGRFRVRAWAGVLSGHSRSTSTIRWPQPRSQTAYIMPARSDGCRARHETAMLPYQY